MSRWTARIGVIFASLTLVLAFGGVAHADSNIIEWTGHGAENLPCEFGAHWVLAPAFGIESATLYVSDPSFLSFTMVQNGNGSWWADSPGPLSADMTASVMFTGPGDARDQLQLSHCLEGGTPSPTPTPTPTDTPSPSTTPPPTTSSPPPTSSTSTHTPPPSSTHTKSPHSPEGSKSSEVPTIASTGLSTAGKVAAVLAACLLILGSLALRLGSKSR